MIDDIKKYIKSALKREWDLMGSPGSCDYHEIATEDEKHHFGRFRQLEVIWSKFFNNEDWTQE